MGEREPEPVCLSEEEIERLFLQHQGQSADLRLYKISVRAVNPVVPLKRTNNVQKDVVLETTDTALETDINPIRIMIGSLLLSVIIFGSIAFLKFGNNNSSSTNTLATPGNSKAKVIPPVAPNKKAIATTLPSKQQDRNPRTFTPRQDVAATTAFSASKAVEAPAYSSKPGKKTKPVTKPHLNHEAMAAPLPLNLSAKVTGGTSVITGPVVKEPQKNESHLTEIRNERRLPKNVIAARDAYQKNPKAPSSCRGDDGNTYIFDRQETVHQYGDQQVMMIRVKVYKKN